MLTRWGYCSVAVKRWTCLLCDETSHGNPKGVDDSGLSPAVLRVVLDLCTRLPYREAQANLLLQRLPLSISGCERVHQSYARLTQLGVKRQLERQAERPLQSGGGRSWVVQTDGVFVMERDKPVPGRCEGREVKQAVMFALDEPQARQYVAHAGGAESFSPLVHGLQRQVGMGQEDKLVGVADGAPWIDKLFEELGVEVRILDVYHATQYLERVMLALGWCRERREAERASWQRGDINARLWLNHYLPDPEQWLSWEEQDQAALRYLESRLAQLDYCDFKAQGYPIGSGVIEGANKSIIGARMKRGGMRWSHEGINRMATMRCEQASAQPLLDFDLTRMVAFP